MLSTRSSSHHLRGECRARASGADSRLCGEASDIGRQCGGGRRCAETAADVDTPLVAAEPVFVDDAAGRRGENAVARDFLIGDAEVARGAQPPDEARGRAPTSACAYGSEIDAADV